MFDKILFKIHIKQVNNTYFKINSEAYIYLILD